MRENAYGAGAPFTAGYALRRTPEGCIFTFFCELTGMAVYSTLPLREDCPAKAEALAREQARPYFNRCAKCHRWVGDSAYNIDEMRCLQCAPGINE